MSELPNRHQTHNSTGCSNVDTRQEVDSSRHYEDDVEAYRWLDDHHDDPYEHSLALTGSETASDENGMTEQEQLLPGASVCDGDSGSKKLAGPFSPIRTRARQYSLDDEDETNRINNAAADGENVDEEDEKKPASWRSLPHKSQLAIITFARLSEPLAQTSLQAYMFYQLKSFDPSLPDATISKQTGIIQGCFTAAQFVTSVFWGRLADTETFGRKRVLLVGLLGTAISCLGFGFSKSFISAAIFRTLGGALNSNIGVMRTMISEIIEKKKYQSRAFLLLPMCFNVGIVIGPILGGVLADPIKAYPGLFGPGSFLGGKDGVWWMRKWPYALPNIVSGLLIFSAALAIFLGLEETHEIARYRSDWGLKIGRAIKRFFTQSRSTYKYQPLDGTDYDDRTNPNSIDLETSVHSHSAPASPTTAARAQRRKRPSFRQIWTPNVVLTMLTHFLLAFHASAFTALCFVFLPNPRAPGSRTDFFHFGGGLGMPSSRVGLATAIIGVIGLPLQIFVYPRVQFKLGTLKAFRVFLPFSPLAYVIAPFLVLVPDKAYLVWPALTVVFALQVVSRTFALPAMIILVNNSVTDPSVLGTVHGVAQSISSAARTLGPLIGAWGLGLGLERNIVGAVWWALAIEALIGWVLTWTIFEDKGIERKPAASRQGR
ncbi:hypothetical protein VTO42DRAFT_1267 [Malbranchea cinnamomea]